MPKDHLFGLTVDNIGEQHRLALLRFSADPDTSKLAKSTVDSLKEIQDEAQETLRDMRITDVKLKGIEAVTEGMYQEKVFV